MIGRPRKWVAFEVEVAVRVGLGLRGKFRAWVRSLMTAEGAAQGTILVYENVVPSAVQRTIGWPCES